MRIRADFEFISVDKTLMLYFENKKYRQEEWEKDDLVLHLFRKFRLIKQLFCYFSIFCISWFNL